MNNTRSSEAAVAGPSIARGLEWVARVLLASLFLWSGVGKFGTYAGLAAYMSSAGVPGQLLPLVIALEIGGSLAIIAGWRTRIAALLLAAFTLASAAIFHDHASDHTQMIMFWKNVAITGGFLLLVV